MNILHLDKNHPLLIKRLDEAGYINHRDYTRPKSEVQEIIHRYDGIVIRSRFKIDKEFIDRASNLKFIARVGAGLESIDIEYAEKRGITLIAAPEGNRNAVAEHCLGMLLSLMNNLNRADRQVRAGLWKREENRGHELEGKIVGIIGYGNTGKALANKLKGFNCTVFCHDILDDVGDENATQVSLKTLQEMADVLSLHVPLTPLTDKMVNSKFLYQFTKPIWLLNSARGKCLVTEDLVEALNSGQVLGAGLDVLEYEKSSFESLFDSDQLPEPLQELIQMDNVILSPHIAGWTEESKVKLAETIVEKIQAHFS